MKKLACIVLLVFSGLSFAQNVSDYQYVLVPTKFAFSKEVNPFGISTLTKGLLEKYKFKAFLDTDAIPDEILRFNCNKLYADVIEDNTITTTKLSIVLKDCKGTVVYQTAQGKSRTKEWRVGYNEALRDAGRSFDVLHYHYNGKNGGVSENAATALVVEPAAPVAPVNQGEGQLLFAQPIANGFQLIDSTPKIVMKILKTGASTVYLAEKEALEGVVRQQNGQWLFEYYQAGKLVAEPIQIKF
ncbi:hypothetical protein [Flavobacterium caeni]|uniref:Uncharacterized protein n=1 Tax=Flavobacterium caeni TaxID=490189 RepID=A0A1G5F7W1_9FLAO|nr:hypothetical protein [Flavobacterium caeni]SCY35297.1 hypothetical protein SAMN02927903_01203 [Flavobacterium caeni]